MNKLFIIELQVGSVWCPIRLYKGEFRAASELARKQTDLTCRIRRVKNQAEREQYLNVPYSRASMQPVEWVN